MDAGEKKAQSREEWRKSRNHDRCLAGMGRKNVCAISYQGLANVQALSDMNVEIEKNTINVSRPMELSYFCNEAAGSSVTLRPAARDRERPHLCRLVGLQIERKGNDVALANPAVVQRIRIGSYQTEASPANSIVLD